MYIYVCVWSMSLHRIYIYIHAPPALIMRDAHNTRDVRIMRVTHNQNAKPESIYRALMLYDST